jgi:hypothetical protein
MIEQPFKLTREELNSALWKKLQIHFKERLDIARQENDYNHDERTTAKIRGRITAYKEFLELGETEE